VSLWEKLSLFSMMKTMMMDTAEGNESPNRSTEGKTSARRQKEGKKNKQTT